LQVLAVLYEWPARRLAYQIFHFHSGGQVKN
jgi:hypothetical protein